MSTQNVIPLIQLVLGVFKIEGSRFRHVGIRHSGKLRFIELALPLVAYKVS
jgi:hypothetical protein